MLKSLTYTYRIGRIKLITNTPKAAYKTKITNMETEKLYRIRIEYRDLFGENVKDAKKPMEFWQKMGLNYTALDEVCEAMIVDVRDEGYRKVPPYGVVLDYSVKIEGDVGRAWFTDELEVVLSSIKSAIYKTLFGKTWDELAHSALKIECKEEYHENPLSEV